MPHCSTLSTSRQRTHVAFKSAHAVEVRVRIGGRDGEGGVVRSRRRPERGVP